MNKVIFWGNKNLFNKVIAILPKNISAIYLPNLKDIKRYRCDLLVYAVNDNEELEKFTPEYRAYLNLTNIPIIYIFDMSVSKKFHFKNDLDDYMIKPFYIKDIITRIEIRLNVKKLQDKLRELINEQLTILDLSSVFTSHYNYKKRLKTVVTKLSKIFNADDVSMILINQNTSEVVTDLNSDPKRFINIPIDLNKYPEVKEAISIRKPLYIKDINKYEKLSPYIDQIRKKGIKSMLILPIIYHNEVMGVISIKFKKIQKDDTYDHLLKYSMIVTNTTAIALKNAQILETISQEMIIKTSHKVKQQEMAKSLKQYSHFIDKAYIPVLLVDITGSIHFINNHVENILEYDRFKLLTINFFSLFNEKNRKKLIEKLKNLSNTNYYTEFESNINLPSNGIKKFKFNISLLQKNIFLIQIDDRHETNISLKNKIISLNNIVKFYENLIDISEDAYIGVNKEGHIILFNEGAERILGYNSKEVKDLKIWQIYPNLEAAKKIGRELHKNNGKIKSYRTKLKSKFNNLISVKLNAFFIYDRDGLPIGSIGIFRQIF